MTPQQSSYCTWRKNVADFRLTERLTSDNREIRHNAFVHQYEAAMLERVSGKHYSASDPVQRAWYTYITAKADLHVAFGGNVEHPDYRSQAFALLEERNQAAKYEAHTARAIAQGEAAYREGQAA